jgi:hypothetical protein
MTRVFADTFYFLAALNRQDPAHEAALKCYGDSSLHFVTTEWVMPPPPPPRVSTSKSWLNFWKTTVM